MDPTKPGKIIGIVGTRRRNGYNDYKLVEVEFFKVYKPGDWICSGGCPTGGDRFAEKIAKSHGIPILTFYPDWKKFGRGAGIVRNTYIAYISDVLIACVAEDRTGGTEDTITKFEKHRKVKAILV